MCLAAVSTINNSRNMSLHYSGHMQ